jgi:hypothetical protein
MEVRQRLKGGRIVREEIMMILGMLEEGKITSDQAALLIEAVVETVGLYDLEEPLPSFKDDAKNAGECHHHESAEKPGGEGVKGVADKLSGLADVVDRAALERLVERIRDTLEGAVKSTDQFMGRIQREVMSRKRTNGSSDWVLSLSTNVKSGGKPSTSTFVVMKRSTVSTWVRLISAPATNQMTMANKTATILR